MAYKKAKCPKCGSTSVWVHISIVAKRKYNGNRIYDYEPWNTDNYFGGDCGCDKCDWRGSDNEFVY